MLRVEHLLAGMRLRIACGASAHHSMADSAHPPRSFSEREDDKPLKGRVITMPPIVEDEEEGGE